MTPVLSTYTDSVAQPSSKNNNNGEWPSWAGYAAAGVGAYFLGDTITSVAKTVGATMVGVAVLETVNNSIQSNNYRAVVQSENRRQQDQIGAVTMRMLLDSKYR